MSSLNLVYFPARGRAELARVVMAAAGVEWTETVVSGETMQEWKESGKLAFGQVPLLQDGDLNIVQSNAIVRHIARKYKVYGDEKASAVSDMIMEQGNDFASKMIPLVYPTLNKEKFPAFRAEQVPLFFQQIEDAVSKYSDVLGQEKLCLGDLVVFLLAESYISVYKLVEASAYPKVVALMEKVAANENVSKYLKSDKRYPPRKME